MSRAQGRASRLISILTLLFLVLSCFQVGAASPLLDLDFKGADIRDVLRALSIQQGVNIIPDETVSGPVTIRLNKVTFEDGLTLLLSAYGYTYTKEGENLYRVTRQPYTLDYNAETRSLTLKATQADLGRLVRSIIEVTNVNILLDKGVEEQKVTLAIMNMTLETALRALAESQGLQLITRDGYYTMAGGGQVAGGFLNISVQDGKLTLEARDTDLGAMLREVSRLSGLNIITERDARGAVSGFLRDVPLQSGLRTFLEANGFQVAERGETLLVRKAPPNNSLSISLKANGKLDITVYGTDLATVLRELADRTGVNMVTYNYVRTQINDIRLRDVTLDEALSLILKGTNFTFRKSGNTYLIGDGSTLRADSVDLIETRLIRLKYIQAETVPTLLPPVFSANSIRVIKDQNALSVTGTPEFIQRVQDYLDGIDQPSRTRNEVVPLQHINAEDIPKLLPPNIDKNGILVLKDQNAVVVSGSEQYTASVKEYLAKIDFRAQQILFDVLVVEYSDDTGVSLGLKSISFTEGPYSLSAGSSDANSNLLPVALQTGTVTLAPTFQAQLNAQIEQGKAKVLANPKIATLHGRPAQFSVLTKRRYWDPRYDETITDTTGTGGNGGSGGTTTGSWDAGVIRSVDTGIKLELKPWVSASGEITLEIQPEISDSAPAGDPSKPPDTNERSAKTTVRVKDGETIIIGGLIQTTRQSSKNKIPVLGDIPLLGLLFQNTVTKEQQSEFVIYITPHLVDSAAEANQYVGPNWAPGEEKQPGLPAPGQPSAAPEAAEAKTKEESSGAGR